MSVADAGGDVVLITGAAAGIGRATAAALVDRGCRVALVDRDPAVRDTAAEFGPRARGYVGDVASADDWARVVAATHDELGSISGLVSNALVTDRTSIDAMSEDSWHRQLDVNLTGAFHGVRAVLPDLLTADEGRIVMVSSVHAAFGLPDVPGYAATKAGITGLTRQLAVQYGPQVRVNCVVPGPILTAQWDDVPDDARRQSATETVLGRLGRPEEVASTIVFLLSEQSSFITGSTITVDGGWSITKNST